MEKDMDKNMSKDMAKHRADAMKEMRKKKKKKMMMEEQDMEQRGEYSKIKPWISSAAALVLL